MRSIWIGLAAGLTLLTGCAHGPKHALAGPPVAPTQYMRDYVGPGQHYRLRVPDTWQLARFAIHERTADALSRLHPAAQTWVGCDYLPYAAKQPSEPLFSIITFKMEDWLGMSWTERSRFDQVIAQTPRFVFVAMLPAASPYPARSDDERLFNLMRRSLVQIQAGFILPDGRSALANQYASATGNYEAYLPDRATAKWRKLVLTLRADGSALLTEEPGSAQASRREQARWQQTQDVVLLQLLTPTGKPAGMPLVWTVSTERLLPRAWDRDLYGFSGLLMRRSQQVPVQGLSKN